MIQKGKILTNITCHHCGDTCKDDSIKVGENSFCCFGCKSVFEILSENNMCTYYDMNAAPGINQKNNIRQDKFAFLEEASIKAKLIQFTDGKQSHVSFYLPQIHCSSCLWLLDNIIKFNAGIIASNVNFVKKDIFISYDENVTSLRAIVETLTAIGYEPHLSLNDVSEHTLKNIDRSRWYKLGIAGFCFTNIMMMSLSEYFVNFNQVESNIQFLFRSLSILLSIPVLIYCASEFFIGALNGLKNKYLNIDLPVALALVITFVRSIYEISFDLGSGYLDSLTGIVFFMLIGRWLQSRTYSSISFDRDFKSFLPIALSVIEDGEIIQKEIAHVKVNDVIQLHSNEIIPVDCILSQGNARIDYSFVNGESDLKTIKNGEIIYSGGKQKSGLIEAIVVKEVSQTYLTNLWNNPIFKTKVTPTKSIYDIIGTYFTYAVLIIGFVAGAYWMTLSNDEKMWNAITTVLIVACPCALLLSNNFTNGNILRILGLNKFYLKSPDVIEKFQKINHIVFDKTGTLTQMEGTSVRYVGKILSAENKLMIASLTRQSTHPSSSRIFEYLNLRDTYEVKHFVEVEGQGIEAWMNEHHVKIGSVDFTNGQFSDTNVGSKTVISIDGNIIGEFNISNKYRVGISNQIKELKNKYSISLISGDNDAELQNVENLLGEESEIYFNMSPEQKLNYIKNLQDEKHLSVMMVGDGLNDAGALKQSDLGIVLSNSTNSFSPSSDGVLDGNMLVKLNQFIDFAKSSKNIILLTFGISAIYNAIGLAYAVQGILSPVIAAILMPLSSITIILLTYGLTSYYANKYNFKY
jgi:P-type Cu+ transporter